MGEEVQKEVEETKRSSERLIDTLRAVLEETDIRIAELKKDAYEFKRDIVVGAEHFRTGKTMAEKVIRYMEDKLRQKDSIIEKLRLKNATLKSQAQKVDAQLRQKEEMGDVLHYIDFHQLQIENKQYVAKIEERNQELLKLKMTTGSTVQVSCYLLWEWWWFGFEFGLTFVVVFLPPLLFSLFVSLCSPPLFPPFFATGSQHVKKTTGR